MLCEEVWGAFMQFWCMCRAKLQLFMTIFFAFFPPFLMHWRVITKFWWIRVKNLASQTSEFLVSYSARQKMVSTHRVCQLWYQYLKYICLKMPRDINLELFLFTSSYYALNYFIYYMHGDINLCFTCFRNLMHIIKFNILMCKWMSSLS